MLYRLREHVLDANLQLVRSGLVLDTFGNASGISREDNLIVIKPSGVRYEQMKPEDLVVTDLDGRIVEGTLRPSSDLPTHVTLYKAFPQIGGVAHTHSEYATSWAQARRAIPCFGTTHADYFYGSVPVTDTMTAAEIASDYEKNTGDMIVRLFQKLDYISVPAALVGNHGPFSWGKDASEAVHNAVTLEAVARMAYFTLRIDSGAETVPQALHDKHYFRKHGTDVYYGQSGLK
jgi:L-ribulose-5-phosphate 4-epimerase